MNTIAIGQIQKSHGVRGYLKVKSFSGEFDHFRKLKEVYLKGKKRDYRFDVEDIKPFGNEVLLKLEGIDTPERGRELFGFEIWVERKDAAPLGKGEYYLADLYQCDVVQNGEICGKVKSISEGSAYDLIEIALTSGKTIMVPFVERFVGKVDIEACQIELKTEFETE
jgi:16S rRNA processing protein RimM